MNFPHTRIPIYTGKINILLLMHKIIYIKDFVTISWDYLSIDFNIYGLALTQGQAVFYCGVAMFMIVSRSS